MNNGLTQHFFTFENSQKGLQMNIEALENLNPEIKEITRKYQIINFEIIKTPNLKVDGNNVILGVEGKATKEDLEKLDDEQYLSEEEKDLNEDKEDEIENEMLDGSQNIDEDDYNETFNLSDIISKIIYDQNKNDKNIVNFFKGDNIDLLFYDYEERTLQ